MNRWLYAGLLLFVLILVELYYGNDILRRFQSDAQSISHGSTSNGSLENGKRLPTSGPNFTSYARLGALLGRTAVHHQVQHAILDAFAILHTNHPELRYMIGETGKVNGGPFPPHRTHQNGLSVDFMVPVRDQHGDVTSFPASPFNKFGYNIEFDNAGEHGTYVIDFEALALHLTALRIAAAKHNLAIDRVIFDPALQPLLFAAPSGKVLRNTLPFSSRQAWVRHDEHYHVDFRLID
ncbi:MAG: penicillin-insensitive murein endopeptidase [Bacteroidota bacterium]